MVQLLALLSIDQARRGGQRFVPYDGIPFSLFSMGIYISYKCYNIINGIFLSFRNNPKLLRLSSVQHDTFQVGFHAVWNSETFDGK